MSIVRDITTTSQHLADPNLAVIAGFGSVAPYASTDPGGHGGSICSTQHREESTTCEHPPISPYGSLISRGLEQGSGGYVDNRGRARKLYDATSAVEESATCLDRQDTYQLGRNEAQFDVTGQAQTAWQEGADIAKAANFGRNETELQQGLNDDNDMKGRKFPNFFPGKTHSEKIKIFKS